MVTHISSVTDIGKMLVLVPRKLPVSTKAFPGKGDSGFVPASVLMTCKVRHAYGAEHMSVCGRVGTFIVASTFASSSGFFLQPFRRLLFFRGDFRL